MLVLIGVLLTTAAAPANDWRDVSDTGYLLNQTDNTQAFVPQSAALIPPR